VDCLSEETLFDLARGKLSGERLEAALTHVASCSDCAALLAHAAPALEGAHGAVESSASDTAQSGGGTRTAAPAALKIGMEVRGTYRVVRLIGRGGMGVVYEVTHARLHGRYALKLMNPEFAADQAALSRFRREAQVTSSLRHPNIVQVIDFDQTEDGRSFLAMEFLDGPTMADHLDAHGPLPLPSAIAIIRQIADALEAAHKAGVVHRDLKPENVVLVPQDEGRFLVKLLDFGLSKMRAGSLKITGSTALLGTPTYMTPEQALGEVDKVDARTDQYSLGTLAWETLVGKPPFRGDSIHAVLYQIIHQPPPATKTLSPGVERVLRRALAKERDERFPSVSAFAEALVRAADENPSAPPVVRGPSPPSQRRSRAWLAAAAAAGLGFAALGLLRPRPTGPAPTLPAQTATTTATPVPPPSVSVPPGPGPGPGPGPASPTAIAAPPDAAPPPRAPARVRAKPRPAPPAPPPPVTAAPVEIPAPALPPDAAPPPRKGDFPQPLRKL
jgi:eukaryotic-like serine/threonine-protein kinase